MKRRLLLQSFAAGSATALLPNILAASGIDGPPGLKAKWLPILKKLYAEKLHLMLDISPAFREREKTYQSARGEFQDEDGHRFHYLEPSHKRGERVSLSGKIRVSIAVATGKCTGIGDSTLDAVLEARGKAKFRPSGTWSVSRALRQAGEYLERIFYRPSDIYQLESATNSDGGQNWLVIWRKKAGRFLTDDQDSFIPNSFQCSLHEELGFKQVGIIGEHEPPESYLVTISQRQAIRIATERAEAISSGKLFGSYYSPNHHIVLVKDVALTAAPRKVNPDLELSKFVPKTRLCWRVRFQLMGDPAVRTTALFAPMWFFVDAETGEIIRDHY